MGTDIRRRIIRYFREFFTEKAVVQEGDVINDLSPSLRNEVSKLVIHEDVRLNPLFDNLPTNAIARLGSIVQRVFVDEGHAVVQQGEAGLAMFIVNKGIVRREQADVDGKRFRPRVMSVG